MPAGMVEICVAVTVVNDIVPETCVETFTVGIESVDALVGSPSMIQVQIFDNDRKLIDF